jgi:hypothetical protein
MTASKPSWFVDKMERDDAVQYLKARPAESFIVRLNKAGQHCVTARLLSDEFVHTLIEQRSDGKFVVPRRNDAPVVAESVQHALELLNYLKPAPAADSLYTAAAPSSMLRPSAPPPAAAAAADSQYIALPIAAASNAYASLPLNPRSIAAVAPPPSGVDADGHLYVPMGQALGDAATVPGVKLFAAPARGKVPQDVYRPPGTQAQPQPQYQRPAARR